MSSTYSQSFYQLSIQSIENKEIKEVYKDPYFRTKQVGDEIQLKYIDTTDQAKAEYNICLLYTSPSPRD